MASEDYIFPSPIGIEQGFATSNPRTPSNFSATSAMRWLSLNRDGLCVSSEVTKTLQGPEYATSLVNLVMVFGKVGSGKSTLMNALLGETAFEVGHTSKSCTQGAHLRLASMSQHTPKIGFVDMEGQSDKGDTYDLKLALPLLATAKVR